MSWIWHRNVSIGILAVSAVILLGLVSSLGITVGSPLPLLSQFSYGQLIGLGNAYVFIALIKKYM